MQSWKKPTPEQLDRAVARLGQTEQHRYFFDNLQNPEWIPYLLSKGFFHHPLGANRDRERGTIQFPPWPESAYLRRMVPSAPEIARQVQQIFLALPPTDNAAIHEDIVNAALLMPPALAAPIGEKAAQWIESTIAFGVPESMARLAVHLAKGGEAAGAMALAKSLLSFLPRAKGERIVEEQNDIDLEIRPEAQAYLSDMSYEAVIRIFLPDLVDGLGAAALELFADLLEAALPRDQRTVGHEDWSYIWRPAIEESYRNEFHVLKQLLVSAVRDCAEHLARMETTDVKELVARLEVRPRLLFHRIALHLVRLNADRVPQLAHERLLDKSRFTQSTLFHEYVLLLAQEFPKLSPGDQRQILNWIDAEPEIDQRDWLTILRDALPPDERAKLEGYTNRFGSAQDPEFPTPRVSAVQVGLRSPKTAEDMQAATVEDLVAYLDTWRPAEDPFGPSVEGVAQTLMTAVAAKPEQFAEEALRFRNTSPEYLDALFAGLSRAVQQKKAILWAPVLELCGSVLDRAQQAASREDIENSWKWPTRAMTTLLSDGLESEVVHLPIVLRVQVWHLIERLAAAPSVVGPRTPLAGLLQRDEGSIVAGTTASAALFVAVQYARWVCREMVTPEKVEPDRAGFAVVPEVAALLDFQLRLALDLPPAMRAAMGKATPLLVSLDSRWTKDNLDRIFPPDEAAAEHWQVAWETYLAWWPPYKNVFQALITEYERAIHRAVLSDAKKVAYIDHGRVLAEHLMLAYSYGWLNLSPGGVIEQFFSVAPARLRADALGFVGRRLGEEGQIGQDTIEKMKALWVWRTREGDRRRLFSCCSSERAEFSWWFLSGKFDTVWALEELLKAFQAADDNGRQYIPFERILGRLESLVAAFPHMVLRTLAALIRRDREGWSMLAYSSRVYELLARTMTSGHAETVILTTDLIHELGSRGYHQFRALLQQSSYDHSS
jgi:hypothetical protein